MLETVGPIGSAVATRVSQIEIDVLGDKHLDKLCVTLSGRDMQAAKALLVLYLRITATIQELGDDIFHIKLGGQMHGSITANRLIIGLIYLCLRLQQNVNDCFFLLVHSEMQWCLTVDIGAIDIDFVVIEEGDYVVDVTVDDGVEQDVGSNFLHVTYHTLNFKFIIFKN